MTARTAAVTTARRSARPVVGNGSSRGGHVSGQSTQRRLAAQQRIQNDPMCQPVYPSSMGKVIYSMNVSLDGYVETPDHSLDWALVDEEVHGWWNEQMRRADAVVWGRRIFELMAAH